MGRGSVLLLFILAVASRQARSATYYSKGTQFLLTFMYNYHPEPNVNKANFLFVTADTPGHVIVEMAPSGDDDAVFINTTVSPSTAAVIPIPNRAELEARTGTSRQAVSVISDVPVAVYALNEDSSATSGDAVTVLPVPALSTHYAVPSVPTNPLVAIAAVRDDTTVTVDLRTNCGIDFGGKTYHNKERLTVSLRAYDVFQLYTPYSNTSTCDLGGTLVNASRPVAVFSGSSCAKFTTACDHVAEMVAPVEHWGTKFVVPDLFDQNPYKIRLVSLQNNNRVFTTEHHRDHSQHTEHRTLEAGQVLDWDIPDGTTLEIFSYEPIHVSQYDAGYAPFVIPIPSIDHFGWNYTVTTMENIYGTSYLSYMNIVIKTDARSSLVLDGSTLSANWTELFDIGYSVTSFHIGKGTHKVTARAPFLVQLYGYYSDGSYGYLGGYALNKLPSDGVFLATPSGPSTGGGGNNTAGVCNDEPGFDCKLFDQTLAICRSVDLAIKHCKRYCNLCDRDSAIVG